MNKRKGEKESGSALVIVLLFTLLSVILSAALLTSAGTHMFIGGRQVNMEQAVYLAEAGVERAAQIIALTNGYMDNTTTGSGSLGEGTFNYTVTKTGWREYSVNAVGSVNGLSRRVSIDRLYLPTYAKYALWMDYNGEIYFIPGEEFFGHVHSNDKLWFSSSSSLGGPHFYKEASSSHDTYGGNITWVQFDMGFEMEAEEGGMADVDFTEMKSLANTWGLILEGRTYIEFDDNDMIISNSREGWTDEVVPIGDDMILYIKNSSSGPNWSKSGKAYMDGGELDGRLTIVTENDIKIRDHITYEDDPRDNPDSDDALGLISKDDIWITTSAPDDLEIFAAMMATGQYSGNKGSFGVLKYWQDDHRGALQIYGSIVQDVRGAVGTFNASGPVSGYYKDYSFDDRFEVAPPPYYPIIEDSIEFDGWSEGPA